jgi:Ca2+-binding RTX toxin-like protein
MTALVEAIGGEVQLDPGGAFPSSTLLSSGNCAVAWLDMTGTNHTLVQLFSSDGSAIGSPYTLSDAINYNAIAPLTSGGFVVAYTTNSQLCAQIFDANGSPQGSAVALGNIDYYSTSTFDIAELAGGDFAASWRNGSTVSVHMFDASGTSIGTLTADVGAGGSAPQIIQLTDGTIALTWHEYDSVSPYSGGYPDGYEVAAELFSATGTPLSSKFIVNESQVGSHAEPKATALTGGGFVITWVANGGTDPGILGQLYDANGNPVGSNIHISDLTPGYQSQPDVSALPWGGFLVAWADDSSPNPDHSGQGIRAQLFDASGAAVGDTFQVDAQHYGSEVEPSVVVLSATEAAIFYHSDYPSDPSGLLERSIALPIVGTPADDILSGTGDVDRIAGLEGNDTIRGNDGDDALYGGAGNDYLDGGNGNDTLDGGDGNDVIIGGDGNDVIQGGNGANSISDGNGNDIVYGGADSDIFQGSAGDDYYNGADGFDWVYYNSAEVLAGITVDMRLATDQVRSSGSGDAANVGVDTLSNVESVVGSGFDDVMIAGNTAMTFYGNDGDDSLTGGAGNDVLDGGAGHDTITGGAGNDTFLDSEDGHNGDTITDLSVGEKIVFTDASLGSFTYSISGHILTYTGGSLTLTNLPIGQFVASAAAGGGVQLRVDAPTQRAPHDFNGDGYSDVILQNDSGQTVDWLGSANGALIDNSAVFSTNPGTNWHVEGLGDFNGDGYGDVLWRSDSGAVVTFLGQSNGSFVGNVNFNLNPGLDWHVEGTGDFNGDGRDDILWRNDAGTVVTLLGNGNGSFTGNVNFNLNPGLDWHVEGTGDFNGDGRDDILWRSDNGTVVTLLGNENGSFTGNVNFNLNPGLDWHIEGTGDFNGDGRDDILWRNDAGQVVDLLGNADGSFTGNVNFNLNPGLDWHIVQTGDFNGDGYDDIVWRSDAGTVTDLLGQPNGAFIGNVGNFTASLTSDWHVEPQHALF